jgi:hypothetical protein
MPPARSSGFYTSELGQVEHRRVKTGAADRGQAQVPAGVVASDIVVEIQNC